MRRRRREDSEGVREDEDDGVERREREGRSRGSVKPAQLSGPFRIRWSVPYWRSLLLTVMMMTMMMGGAEGLRCQCSRSTDAAHCSQQLCDIKPREGKVPACVFVRDGPLQHYACIRVEEEDEMGCRVMRGRTGGHKVACMCRDADMCNVDLSDRVDDGGEDRRILKVPAELIGEPSVVRVRAEQTREGREHDVLLEPDRDDSLGVAPSVVDFFDEESEIGVGRGGKGGGGGLNHREKESWSEEEEKRFPSSAYRFVHGVDNGQLVPLTVKRLEEEKRSKLEENIIDLTKPGYRRPVLLPSPARPPVYPPETRRPDWRQPGTQPVPQGPFDPVRREEEKRRQEEGQHRVHRVEWTTRSRPQPPPPSTTTTPSPPSPPSRPPTPFTIGRINTFVERPSPDPIPYPRQRWDDRPSPPLGTTTTTSTTTTTETTTTTPATRRMYSVSVSRYVVSTSTTTVPPITTTTTEPTTSTTEPTTTTTEPTTTTTVPTTTTTVTPTTTVRSTVVPSTTTVDYDDIDGGEEEKEDYDHVVLASGTKTNTVPRVAEKEPDSGTINTIWTTVVVTVVLIGLMH